MPHKRNPVASEQICGLARVVRGNAVPAFEDIALWHERDISHSSVERVILPDSTILVDYMLHRTREIVANMKVFPERMLRNLNSTQGLVFSGQLLQDLVQHGAAREDAYKWVQAHAMAAWQSESSFQDRIAADENIRRFLDEKALAHTFDLRRQLRAVDDIFARVFGRDAAATPDAKSSAAG
jgi:adenylosuccinate lyase